jgi:hypothetical protein
MTPKEKAEQLVGKCFDTFINDDDDHYLETAWGLSKQCALVAVDEIIKELTEEISPSVHGFRHRYWEEVKQEIEKL